MGSDHVPARRPLVEVVVRIVRVFDADGSMALFLTSRLEAAADKVESNRFYSV
jgi:hypothetical protein